MPASHPVSDRSRTGRSGLTPTCLQFLLVRSRRCGWAFLLCSTVCLLSLSLTNVSAQEAVGSAPLVPAPNEASSASDTAAEQGSAEAIGADQQVQAPSGVQTTQPPVEPASSELLTPGGGGYSSVPRRLHYKLEGVVRESYDDNINLTSSNRTSDWYTSIEPKLTIGFGDIDERKENFIRLDYSPNPLIFMNHSENNAFQQAIFLEGQDRFERLQIKLSENIQIIDSTDIGYRTNLDEANSQVNLDVTGRTKLDVFTTNIGASYDLSSKTFVTVDGSDDVLNYQSSGLLDSQTIAGDFYLNYRYSDKLTVGTGGGVGYQQVDPPTPDQTFEQLNARLIYEIRGKILLNAGGGIELRQFSGARGSYVSPNLQLGGTYLPFPGTELKLNARRSTQSSASLAGEDYSSTGIDLSLRQRLLQRFVLGVAVGYENATYFNAISTVNSNRDDNYYYFAPSLDALITRFWSVGGYYLRRQNDSTGGSGFRDNQIGFRTAFAF
jgi:hypothetical protein